MWNYIWILLVPIIKDFFDLIQKFLYNLCYKNITIEEGSQIYKCMKFYIAKNCKTFNGLVISDKSLECSNYLSHKHLGIVSIAEGKYYINYKSNIISVSVEEEKINIACLAYKEFKILLEFLEYGSTFPQHSFSSLLKGLFYRLFEFRQYEYLLHNRI